MGQRQLETVTDDIKNCPTLNLVSEIVLKIRHNKGK